MYIYILNELSRTHIHTTYMYIYAGLVHIFLYIYIQQVEESACNTLQHTCNKRMQHPATHLQQISFNQVEESTCNTLQHTCNKGVLYKLPLFHRESSVMDAYAERHHCS